MKVWAVDAFALEAAAWAKVRQPFWSGSAVNWLHKQKHWGQFHRWDQAVAHDFLANL